MLRLLLLTLCLASLPALADTKLSFIGSVSSNTPDTGNLDTASGDDKSEIGYGVGMRALMGISEALFFRSGVGLVWKNFGYDVNVSGVKGRYDLSFIYFNVPLTLYWKASDRVGFFGGTALNAKINSTCDESGAVSSCSIKGRRSLVFPLIVGFDFNLSEVVGLELSYEHGITETAKDLKVHSVVGSVLIHF